MIPRTRALLSQSMPAKVISLEQRREIMTLNRLVWPSKLSFDEHVEKVRHDDLSDCDAMSHSRWYLLREEGELRAIARTFRRTIATESGRRFPVLALASVCVHPDFRRNGLGRLITLAAFKCVDEELPVSFFQTPVPEFYERLGARLVTNRIYDSTGADCAFWEPHAMIYPATASWPDEPIDLLGRGW